MNATINGSSCTSPFNQTAEKIGTSFALCLILVVSLVGNFFIGRIIYRTKTMRKPINYFIVNMAVSDLVYSIFGFLFDLTELYRDVWALDETFSQAWCKLSTFVQYICGCVSVESLLLIAVDRFGAVVFPLRSPLIRSKQCLYFIVASWIYAVAIFSPVYFAAKLVKNSEKLVCHWRSKNTREESSPTETYLVAMNIMSFYISITLLITLYSIILYKLKSQTIPGEQPMNTQEQHKRRNRNVLKMAIAIVLAFFICWIPYSVTTLLLNSKWNTRIGCSFFLQLYLITVIMTRASCAINPLIFFIFSGNFRQGLKRIFTCFGALQD